MSHLRNLKLGVFTPQKLAITLNQSLFLFESWFTNTALPTLPQFRGVTKGMAVKEIKVSQGMCINPSVLKIHNATDDKGITAFYKGTKV